MARKTKATWFRPVRGSFLPSSKAGYVVYAIFVGYVVFAMILGMNTTSSPGEAVLFIVPNWIAAATVITFIANRKSSQK